MEEQMVPGDYTALGPINIRLQMKTMPATNQVGGYMNGTSFRVYEVYSEIDGIVWGRVSSNTGEGRARFAALRVNNNVKVKLEKAFEDETRNPGNVIDRGRDPMVLMAEALEGLDSAITLLTVAVRELARK